MIVQSTVVLRFYRASSELDGGHGATIVAIAPSGTTIERPVWLTGMCQTAGGRAPR